MSPVTKREREDTFERLAESFEQAPAAGIAEALGTSVDQVPKAGHMAAVQNPEPVARALADLWERARASAEGS